MIALLHARIMTIIWCITEIGTGLNQCGGGSSLLYDDHIRISLKSILPISVKRGLAACSAIHVWPTDRT